MDRNNDGVIARNEWRGSDRSFDVHDWNDDGVLSGGEVNAGAARAGRTVEDEDFDRHEGFEFLDTNNDGRIEPREWHVSAAAFNRLDVNDDNRISRAEFTAFGAAQTVSTTGQVGIGNQGSIRAPASGRLYLGVNDDHLADNHGQFEVMIALP